MKEIKIPEMGVRGQEDGGFKGGRNLGDRGKRLNALIHLYKGPMMIHSDNLPKLSPIVGRDRWVLLEDWTYSEYTVPKGFETDLDSIPRVPGIHAALKGYARISALLHDYLYRTGITGRKHADELFYDLMKVERVPDVAREAIYLAIRAFGWIRWNELRRK